MKITVKDFLVASGDKVKLDKWPTVSHSLFDSKKQYHEVLNEHVKQLSELQQLHYASSRFALLLMFQGMDAAGKDGAIRHVMSGVNPQGCEVTSFKQPTPMELRHDFLWRIHAAAPPKGMIGNSSIATICISRAMRCCSALE